ncbi:hypothetical protein EDC29_11724 [Marichromatium gracile]|uniref:Uncharacterized protein n=1 Tax=Marichromatium gracile TaxID=1048 RepID=A0A4R4A4I1_MARGR|nr:hypothetical protein EDC29_11724 [Marichromatium gracile]
MTRLRLISTWTLLLGVSIALQVAIALITWRLTS